MLSDTIAKYPRRIVDESNAYGIEDTDLHTHTEAWELDTTDFDLVGITITVFTKRDDGTMKQLAETTVTAKSWEDLQS